MEVAGRAARNCPACVPCPPAVASLLRLSRRCRARGPAGVTLVEMIIVVAIIGLIAGISYPSVASGLDTLRLNAASESLVSLLNSALNSAERRQEPVEVSIAPADRRVRVRSTDPRNDRTLELPEGVRIAHVHPVLQQEEEQDRPRVFMLYPAGAVPRIGVELVNSRNVRRMVRVDPITGVPQIERMP